MKAQANKLWAAMLSLFVAIGVAYGEPPPSHVYIQVKGLACPFCVQGLEKHLKKLDAVEGVSTSLKKGEVVLHLKPGQTVDEKELQQAVKKAGFTAGKIRFEKTPTPLDTEKSGRGEKK
ncbi:MAG: heavy-metal-associated domain-containing protein [Verrucomicrobiales bacterium]|nr:heavy-metal-associated domain-containing protein [Verrucomicrobiales bacterium]